MRPVARRAAAAPSAVGIWLWASLSYFGPRGAWSERTTRRATRTRKSSSSPACAISTRAIPAARRARAIPVRRRRAASAVPAEAEASGADNARTAPRNSFKREFGRWGWWSDLPTVGVFATLRAGAHVNVSAWTHVANRPSLLKYNSGYYRLRIGRLCPPLETREGAHHEIKSRFASSARHKRQN